MNVNLMMLSTTPMDMGGHKIINGLPRSWCQSKSFRKVDLSTLVGKFLIKFCEWTFFSFFSQSTVFSTRTVDGYQLYFGDSVVRRATTIGIEISPTPFVIFTGHQKCEMWRRFQNHSNFYRPVWKCSNISQRCNKFRV